MSTFKYMTKSKIIILLGFGTIITLVSILIIVGGTVLSKSKFQLDRIVNEHNLKIQLVTQMHQSARERTISLQHMFFINNQKEFDKHLDRMAFYGGKFVSTREQFLSMKLNSKEKLLIQQQALLSKKVGPIQNEISDLISFGDIKLAKHLFATKAEPLQEKVFEVLSKLHKFQRNATKRAFKENTRNYQYILRIMWLVSIVVILTSLGIIFFTLRLISKNESEQKSYNKNIEHQAFYDHLTNLPNRRLLNDRMLQAISSSNRNNTLMAILFIDCDRFKPINDSLGHSVGDELLVSIANRLTKNVQSSDTVCRFSGDEFIVVLEGITHRNIIDHTAQNILNAIAEPHFLEGYKVFTTASMGITVYPVDEHDGTGLLTSSDIAMYHAKQRGGNQFEYFNSEMNARSKKRLTLEQDLHEALLHKELKVYYQPKNLIDEKRTTIGAEALLRWDHPDHGLIPPVDFISIAEDSGLIIPIGNWIILTACKQLKQWQQQNFSIQSISVNLSPRQFTDQNLITSIMNALKLSGVAPAKLELEITESTAMYAIDQTINILHKIKKIGVSISIDDFGTGFSSLSYLQKMPIDILKIDRSFIKNIHRSEKDKAFVQAIVTMAHALGMKVVAEGVELEEHFLYLKHINCEIAQGFLFSKPVPETEFIALLQKTAEGNNT